MLQNVARFKGFPPPVLSEDGSRIRYGGRDYHLDEFGEQRAVVAVKHNVITRFRCCVGEGVWAKAAPDDSMRDCMSDLT